MDEKEFLNKLKGLGFVEEQKKSSGERAAGIVGYLVVLFLLTLLLTWLFMTLWNDVIPLLFNLSRINGVTSLKCIIFIYLIGIIFKVGKK